MIQTPLGSVARRTMLAGGGALVLTGCAGTGSISGVEPSRGTAIIGLRIGDSPARQTTDDSASSPWSLFNRKPREPSAEITFGYIEPETGGIDLPILPGYSGKMAGLKTSGSGTTFEAANLIAGRYATIKGHFFTGAHVVYVLRFSAGGNRAVASEEIGGLGFTVNPGEVVYVGTLVLPSHGTGSVRVDDEFEAAASAFPALAQVGRERGSRLMESIGAPKSRRR